MSNSNDIVPNNHGSHPPSTLWDEVAAILSGLIGGGRYGLKIRVPHAFVMTFLFGSRLSFRDKLKVIAKLAAEHASNLAAFACLYKLMLATLKIFSQRIKQGYGDIHTGILRQLSRSLLRIIVNGPFMAKRRHAVITPITTSSKTPPGLPEHPYHAFLSGAIGGYIVWGRYSSVNYQLILYLTSRILVACIKLAYEKGGNVFPNLLLPISVWKRRPRLTFDNTYPWAAAGIWGVVMMLFEEYPEVLHPSLRRSMDEIYRYVGF
mmetsp:Transcript_16324/g.35320  ORF Transcript_16324/g.35320 Transcript_16324/m.35320 type:complete len:263 (-) Transcript_16324:1119-1907(-)